jgi:hypothetical protein
MEIANLYIHLSENEDLIQKDVDSLIEKGIFTLDEITTGDSLLVCISRDYLDLPNNTPAVMIRDQLSNVFCPSWRVSATHYSSLLPIMNLEGEFMPTINITTSNKELYDNLDYYLHLSRFENRKRMLLGVDKTFVPIKSEVFRPEVLELGIISVKVLEMAGYDKDQNKQVPGWIFQCANPWLTRVLDLYEIRPAITIQPGLLKDIRLTREEHITKLNSPILLTGPKIGEDIRTSIVESYKVRNDLYLYSKDLLSKNM